jgi:hypothetical protein
MIENPEDAPFTPAAATPLQQLLRGYLDNRDKGLARLIVRLGHVHALAAGDGERSVMMTALSEMGRAHLELGDFAAARFDYEGLAQADVAAGVTGLLAVSRAGENTWRGGGTALIEGIRSATSATYFPSSDWTSTEKRSVLADLLEASLNQLQRVSLGAEGALRDGDQVKLAESLNTAGTRLRQHGRVDAANAVAKIVLANVVEGPDAPRLRSGAVQYSSVPRSPNTSGVAREPTAGIH